MDLEQNLGFFEENSFSNNDFINYGGITEVYAFMPGPPRGPRRIGGGGGGFKGKLGNIPQYSYSKPFKSIFNIPKVTLTGLPQTSKPLNISPEMQRMIDFNLRSIKKTEYSKLFNNQHFTAGISHHPIGIGKIKIYDKTQKTQYGIPLIDINKKPMKNWRFGLNTNKPFKF